MVDTGADHCAKAVALSHDTHGKYLDTADPVAVIVYQAVDGMLRSCLLHMDLLQVPGLLVLIEGHDTQAESCDEQHSDHDDRYAGVDLVHLPGITGAGFTVSVFGANCAIMNALVLSGSALASIWVQTRSMVALSAGASFLYRALL